LYFIYSILYFYTLRIDGFHDYFAIVKILPERFGQKENLTNNIAKIIFC